MTITIEQAAPAMGPMFETIAGDGRLVLDALALPAGARVLDVGTGVGNFAVFLALSGFQVVTGEPADDATQYAGHDWRARAEAVGVADRIRFEAFKASAMPFADAAFDAVFFFGVLHHIDAAERAATFREALRVARPGASVTFFEPSKTTLERVWKTDPGHPLAAVPSDYQAGAVAPETRLAGQMMDIYSYRKPG